jgi:hypothetical protein
MEEKVMLATGSVPARLYIHWCEILTGKLRSEIPSHTPKHREDADNLFLHPCGVLVDQMSRIGSRRVVSRKQLEQRAVTRLPLAVTD